jgi:type IV secretory pathway VirB10-like protein
MTAKVEARVETVAEPKIEPKVEPKIELKIEPKIEPGPPPATEAKIEPQVPAISVAESEPVLPRTPEAEPRVEPPPAPLTKPRDQVQPQTKSEWKVVAPAPPSVEASVTSEPAEAPVAPFTDFQFATAAAEPHGRRRWLLGTVAVVVIGGIGLLAFFSIGRSSPSAARKPASAVRPEQALLALRVEGAETGLMIQWDALAPAISAARGGRLTITEGGVPSRFNLSADDLKTGRYIYKPRADNLTIRLEVDSQPPGQNVFGLTGVVGATRMLLPASRR